MMDLCSARSDKTDIVLYSVSEGYKVGASSVVRDLPMLRFDTYNVTPRLRSRLLPMGVPSAFLWCLKVLSVVCVVQMAF